MGYPKAKGGPERVYRIGEVAELVELETYVLRYWETEFPTLHPAKSPHGQRLYREADIGAIFTIKRLLYEEGFTIAGARKQLQQEESELRPPATATGQGPSATSTPSAPSLQSGSAAQETLRAVRAELQALLTRLKK